MNSKFTHYLITRYNVRLDQWEKDMKGQSTFQEDWMHHRFDLFSQYCFPSIIAQSAKDFQWLIFFDLSTSREHLQPITSLIQGHPFIHLRLVDGYFGCKQDIDDLLTKSYTPYVITSRLDNDDALGVDYIKTIQSQFIPEDKILINLLHGFSYNPGQQVSTHLYNMKLNHFCSFIEEHRQDGGHTSVRGFPHGNPPPGTRIINIGSKYSWLKVFHERNLLSSPFGYPVFNHRFSHQFGIEKKYLHLNLFSTVRYSIRWFLDGVFRKIKKWASKSKNT